MNKIVEVAEKEIGYTENPPNSNKTKYGTWFGLPSLPWCGIFVSWVYAKAGQPLGNIGFLKGFAGCMTAVNYFKKKNLAAEFWKGLLLIEMVIFGAMFIGMAVFTFLPPIVCTALIFIFVSGAYLTVNNK